VRGTVRETGRDRVRGFPLAAAPLWSLFFGCTPPERGWQNLSSTFAHERIDCIIPDVLFGSRSFHISGDRDMERSRIDPIAYRQRASRLGKCADLEPDTETACRLLHEALSWIQLAENEEYLAAHGHSAELRPLEPRFKN
jgi:hypothetical protein